MAPESPVSASLNRPKRRAFSGISLAETLISLSLLGAVLIPILLMSSTFFTERLLQGRDKTTVVHSASQFMNRFMEELFLTRRILPLSDSTHLYIAYYDVTLQREVKVGYQLTTSGSNKILERLTYSDSTAAWTATSPYGASSASAILLPSSAVFKYCTESACSTTIDEENAVFIRLTGWTFEAAQGAGISMTMPTDLDIYLSAGATAGGVMVSELSRELYTFDATVPFGSSVNLALSSLSPTGNQLNYLATDTLSTGILSIIFNPSAQTMRGAYVDSDGRFFTLTTDLNVAGSFVTWAPSTGLSTIISSGTNFGSFGGITGDGNGRVYFGQYGTPGRFWSWHKDTGLSTIASTCSRCGVGENLAVAGNGRVFFGEWSTSQAKFWTWSSGTLTTIYDGMADPLNVTTDAAHVYPGAYSNVHPNPSTNGVYFGSGAFSSADTNGQFVYWHPSTGISTLVAGTAYPGLTDGSAYAPAAAVAGDGRVFFGENKAAANDSFWTWHPTTGLSTLVSNTYRPGTTGKIAVAPDGRVFFGSQSGASGIDKVWTWHSTTGLSTILSGIDAPGYSNRMAVTDDARVYIGDNNYHVWTWHKDTGLSLIASKFAAYSAFKLAPDGRLYFAENNGASSGFYTYALDTGLSLILTASYVAQNLAGNTAYNGFPIDDNGRVYFSSSASGSNSPVWTWHKDTGLSTILASGFLPVYLNNYGAIPGSTGGVYFLADLPPSTPKWYRWVPTDPTVSVKRTSAQGGMNGQTVSLQYTNGGSPGNYTAATMDASGGYYFVDGFTKQLRYYIYSPASQKYILSNSFNWSSWASSVTAVALDQSSSSIALLDTGNKQIDVYSNRFANGTPSAPTSIDVSAATSPTGLAVSGRTGNYLVLDSSVITSGAQKYVNLRVYSSGGTLQRTIKITVNNDNTVTNSLSYDASTETNFKIAFDDRKNQLYLLSPALKRVFVLSMPNYL